MKNQIHHPLFLRKLLTLLIDVALTPLAFWLALEIRFGLEVPAESYQMFATTWPFVMISAFLIFAGMGFHRQLWRYAGPGQYSVLVAGTLIQTSVLVFFQGFIQITISRAAYLIYFFLISGLLIGLRLAFNSARNSMGLKRALGRYLPGLMAFVGKNSLAVAAAAGANTQPAKRLLIIGAGESGSEVIRELQRHREAGIPVVALDKDPNKRGYKILGVPVLGDLSRLPEAVAKYRVDEVVLALRHASPKEIRPIVDLVNRAGLPLKTVPHLSDLIGGRLQVSELKTFEIQDLLGREEIALNLEQIAIT